METESEYNFITCERCGARINPATIQKVRMRLLLEGTKLLVCFPCGGCKGEMQLYTDVKISFYRGPEWLDAVEPGAVFVAGKKSKS